MASGKRTFGPSDQAAAKTLSEAQTRSTLTREQLGQKAGVSEGQVSDLLNGKKPWNLQDVALFSRALGLSFGVVLADIAKETARIESEARRTRGSGSNVVTGRFPDVGPSVEDGPQVDEDDEDEYVQGAASWMGREPGTTIPEDFT